MKQSCKSYATFCSPFSVSTVAGRVWVCSKMYWIIQQLGHKGEPRSGTSIKLASGEIRQIDNRIFSPGFKHLRRCNFILLELLSHLQLNTRERWFRKRLDIVSHGIEEFAMSAMSEMTIFHFKTETGVHSHMYTTSDDRKCRNMNCKGYNHAKHENILVAVSNSWYEIDWQPGTMELNSNSDVFIASRAHIAHETLTTTKTESIKGLWKKINKIYLPSMKWTGKK